MASAQRPWLAAPLHLSQGGCRVPPARQAALWAHREASVISLQKSRSEGCLGLPGGRPRLPQCSEPGRSRPHLHDGAQAPGSAGPLGAGARKRSVGGPAVNAAVSGPRPCRGDPCQLPSGTPCLLHAWLCSSTPANIGGETGPPPWHGPRPTGTRSRAQSITGCPLRCSEDPAGQSSVAPAPHLKDRMEAEGDTRPGTALPPAPAQVSPVLPAPRGTASCRQDPCGPGAGSCAGGSQETLSEGPRLDNQLGQDSPPRPVPPVPAAESGGLRSQEGPPPAQRTPEHSPESRLGGPPGAGPAPDAAGKQQHLEDVPFEAGNPTSDDTSEGVLSEKSKPPAGPRCPRRPSSSGSQVWTEGTRCSGGSRQADAPKATAESRARRPSREAEDAIGLDPKCRDNALRGFSEITSPAAPRSCGHPGCDQGPEGAAPPLAGALTPAPRADRPSRGRCGLIIIAVEHKGLQATRRGAGLLPETRSCEFLGERPRSRRGAGAAPWEPPGAGTPHTWGPEPQRPAGRSPGGDGGAPVHAARAARGREDTCSQRPAGGVPSPEGPAEDKPPEKGQSSRAGADDGAAARVPSSPPEGARGGAWGGTLGSGDPEGGDALTSSPRTCPPHQTSQEAEPLQPGARALGAEGAEGGPERCADKLTTVDGGPGACGGQPTLLHHVHALGDTEVVPHSPGEGAAGLVGGGDADTPQGPGSRGLGSESCDAQTPQTPEKSLWARLATAHRAFASFFESRVGDKQNADDRSPGSPQGPKGRSRRPQSSWWALLKSEAAGGPQRPPLVSPGPGPEIPAPLPPAPGTQGRCEEPPEDTGGHAVGGHGAPPLSPRSSVCAESRRKSEPTIPCASPPNGGGCLHAGVFAGESWLVSPAGPGAQQPRVTLTVPSASVCCLACGHPGAPSRPLGPKPQRADSRHPGRGKAGSMVFLGSCGEVGGSPEAPERPRTRQAGRSHLCSQQLPDPEDRKEESWERGRRHRGLSTARSLRDLPRSVVS